MPENIFFFKFIDVLSDDQYWFSIFNRNDDDGERDRVLVCLPSLFMYVCCRHDRLVRG